MFVRSFFFFFLLLLLLLFFVCVCLCVCVFLSFFSLFFFSFFFICTFCVNSAELRIRISESEYFTGDTSTGIHSPAYILFT